MPNALRAGLVFLSLAVAHPVAANDGRDPGKATEEALREHAEEAEEALREGAEKVMRSLELMFRSIPQYEMPEINEHGDIIIRRKRPAPPIPPEKPSPDSDITST